jgi:nicotinamide-nucleotide adenylyltransferase
MSSALKDFQSSSSKFRILQTVHPSNPSKPLPPIPTPNDIPKTLFILDSSFNPPSIAHRTLAQSALAKANSSHYATPRRMLLLFSTMNADKAPSAAAFDQRLTLMTVFATDLLHSLNDKPDDYTIPVIDIGVTTAPYYTDKSAAIGAESSDFYATEVKHIHLVGFDTVTRFFAAKYYPKFDPPLSALNPYFEAGHELRVTLRPDDAYGSVAEQKAFVQRLADGGMESEGGKREWAKQVVLVEPNEKAELCTVNVAAWVESEALYADDDRGAKMA